MSTITSPPTHHDSDATFSKARRLQLQQRETQSKQQQDSTRVGTSLLRASNNCSPFPPTAINESISSTEQRLWISSPSRRHKMMLRGIQLWGRRHQETPHLSDQQVQNTAVSTSPEHQAWSVCESAAIPVACEHWVYLQGKVSRALSSESIF